jgi:ring-1,2-phenylacetyl-CoA epoxidase subunit PaaD
VVSTAARRLDAARRIASGIPDPELPMVTVADLGILRDIRMDYGSLVVTITPTYSGCPALTEIARDLHGRLTEAGLGPVTVRTALAPAWTTDWITEEGRRKLHAAGVAPPGPARRGPVPLTLSSGPGTGGPGTGGPGTGGPGTGGPGTGDPGTGGPAAARCPLCDSADTELTAAFSGTACKALRRCRSCGEPFEQVKEL